MYFFVTNFRISLEQILVGLSSSFFIFLETLFFFRIDLIKEYPLECSPLDGIAKIIFLFFTLFFVKLGLLNKDPMLLAADFDFFGLIVLFIEEEVSLLDLDPFWLK